MNIFWNVYNILDNKYTTVGQSPSTPSFSLLIVTAVFFLYPMICKIMRMSTVSWIVPQIMNCIGSPPIMKYKVFRKSPENQLSTRMKLSPATLRLDWFL